MLNIPKHTNCTNCGQCCGIVPASQVEINTIRNYIAVNGISPIKRADKTICPFRDNKNKKCLIYPVRPLVCRLFGVAKGDMQCRNGNSDNIDGEKFINVYDLKDSKIINFMRW